ncbi:M20 family peptidase [Gammaproteobacteria bacterium]|nr:M20 family peptidase [Gammaproteobacteria bacterium]
MVKQMTIGVGVVLLVLSIIVAARTLLFGVPQMSVGGIENINLDSNANAKRLGEALSFRTVSIRGGPVAAGEFIQFHKYLEIKYPRTHGELEHETVNEYSRLYTWQGSDSKLNPVLILAHMDVVPVKQDTTAKWTHPPFGGVVADDYIWGRGALDMKQSLMAVMEAVEYLVDSGFKPDRTIYLAFGHDEEIGGHNGAAKIVELLQARKVQLEFTLDEGSAIVEGIIPNIARPVALIGLAEKGWVALEFTAHGEGGHGSMPPEHTAVGRLARAIYLLETHQMAAGIRRPFSDMFEYLAPEMPFLQRVVVANRWLFDSLLISRLEKSRATNAAIRTTTAITMLKGSDAYNVMPTEATAVGTFRALPGDTNDNVVEHVRNVIDDEDITVKKIGVRAWNPSRVSATDAFGFTVINKAIRQVLPDATVAPSLVVTGTDSKHYGTISENNYRFVPMRVGPEDVKRIHGIDERIGIENYSDIIRFYIQFLRISARSK